MASFSLADLIGESSCEKESVTPGFPGQSWHLEITYEHAAHEIPAPSIEDLMVFYLPDADAWQRAVGRMKAAGFEPVTPGNDYWSERGVTFADPDGFRVVLENAASNF